MAHLEGNYDLLVVEEFLSFQEAKSSNWETFLSSIICEFTCFEKVQKLHLSVFEWSD